MKRLNIVSILACFLLISVTGCSLFTSSTTPSPTPEQQPNSTSYTFQSYTDQEPYYSAYCDKIDPYDLSVREAASKAIKNDPGSYSVSQLLDIYDWVKHNIQYQTVASAGVPYPPNETLATGSGDCKCQAVLIASMIEAIGGTAEVVADPDCTHAYTIVYFGSAGTDLGSFTQAVANHYGSNIQVNYFTMNGGIWVIFDPAGGYYPGNSLPACSGNRTVYLVDSCLSCANQYPNMPYTYGNYCYSQCPSGTYPSSNHSCSSCPAGSYSYNNQCVTCPSGYYLGIDGKCYPQ